jgi:CBS domain-containing protein
MERIASDVMTREVFTASPDLSLIELERELTSRGISGAPVVDEGRLVGVVSRTDVDRLIAEGEEPPGDDETYFWAPDLATKQRELTTHLDRSRVALERFADHCVRDVMTSSVISVGPADPVTDVARLMTERRVHRILVVEDDQLVGLISAFDLVGLLAGR